MNSLRTRLIAIAGAAAVAGLSATLFVSAPGQTAAQPDATVARRAADPAAQKQQHDQMHARVAANLGVTPERLTEAFNQARKDLIQELVQQGKITQEQADNRIARIGQLPKPAKVDGAAGPGKPGAGQTGARVAGPQAKAIGGVVAQALGLTPKDLRDALNGGKTVVQLALEKGISADQLRTLVNDQLEQRLNAALQSGSLTAEQAAQIRARHTQVIENLISGQGRRGGSGKDKQAQS